MANCRRAIYVDLAAELQPVRHERLLTEFGSCLSRQPAARKLVSRSSTPESSLVSPEVLQYFLWMPAGFEHAVVPDGQWIGWIRRDFQFAGRSQIPDISWR